MAWVVCLVALGFSGWLGVFGESQGWLSAQGRYLVQALVMASLVIGGTAALRRHFGTPQNMGVGHLTRGLKHFALGVGIMALPFAITLTLSSALGWVTLQANFSGPLLQGHAVAILAVLLFEAIPEELAFRGYIFGALHERHPILRSATIQVLLFLILPLVLAPISYYGFGFSSWPGEGPWPGGGYIINMLLFGGFATYLRILSGSIWLGVGFHFMFVYINLLFGLGETSLLQATHYTHEPYMQAVLLCGLVLMLIALLVVPWIRRKRVDISTAQ